VPSYHALPSVICAFAISGQVFTFSQSLIVPSGSIVLLLFPANSQVSMIRFQDLPVQCPDHRQPATSFPFANCKKYTPEGYQSGAADIQPPERPPLSNNGGERGGTGGGGVTPPPLHEPQPHFDNPNPTLTTNLTLFPSPMFLLFCLLLPLLATPLSTPAAPSPLTPHYTVLSSYETSFSNPQPRQIPTSSP